MVEVIRKYRCENLTESLGNALKDFEKIVSMDAHLIDGIYQVDITGYLKEGK